jgi:riboflavin kinase/FMN adenylyltransferase
VTIEPKGTAVTVGTFDGVHLGHLKILEKLKEAAAEENLQSVVVTFDPHPQSIVGVKNNKPIRTLTPREEKIRLLREAGIARVVVLPFNREMAEMNYRDFVNRYLSSGLKMKAMIVGHDHALGKNREGRWEELKKLGQEFDFSVFRVEAYYWKGLRISSSAIRKLLEDGKIKAASLFLGRNYRITGTVVSGERRGRILNFPTANLEIFPENMLVPLAGVYAVYAYRKGRRYAGMLNIGNRPTFNGCNVTVEVHILGFKEEIYGEKLAIEFVEWLRPERKFENAEALVTQLIEDKKKCEKILN